MNPFKGEVAFVGENARITKPMWLVKPAEKPEPVSYMEMGVLLFQKKEEMAFHGDVAVSGDYLVRFDQKLGSALSSLWGTIYRSLQQDSFKTNETGDMRGRMLRMEITLHRKESEKKEEREGNPGSPSDSFQNDQEDP
jgi:hypothetical protein